MTDFLLDTNVLSELERRRPTPAVLAFIQRTALHSLFLSEIVLAEIRFGIEMTAHPARREEIELWLDNVIRPMFTGRILRVTEDLLVRWRVMKEVGRRRRYTFPEPDLLLAATAAHHDLTVLTRDTRPFERASVPVINPWRSS